MPDAFLFDTNIASVIWDKGHKDHKQARAFASSLGEDARVMISAVTLAEVEYGLLTAPNADLARQAVMRDAMKSVRDAMRHYPLVMPIGKNTIDYYAEIKSKLFKDCAPRNRCGRLTSTKWPEDLIDPTTAKTLGVQENDIWIAAQAMEMNLVLVTEDKMSRIASLHLNLGLRTKRWR